MIATKPTQARPRPEGRRSSWSTRAAHAAGAEGHAAGGRRRDQHDPQAHRRAGRLGARDPALGRRPDLGRPAGRAERRARDRSRWAPPRSSSSTTGSRTCSATAGRTRPYAGSKALFPATAGRLEAEAEGGGHGRAAGGSGHDARPRPIAQQRQAQRHGRAYYLFGPDELPIGPDKQPVRTGDTTRAPRARRRCSSRLRPRPRGKAPESPRAPRACEELKALGSGGPPAGSQIIEVPQGIVGRQGGAAWTNQPAQIAALLRARGRLGAERHGHQEPEGRASTRRRTRPMVTMEFTDKGRQAFARGHQADRRARARRSSRRPARRATRPSSASRSRWTTRSSRWPRSTTSQNPEGIDGRDRRADRRTSGRSGDPGPGGEPAHRRAADRAQADLEDAGLGDARQAGAPPGPARRAASASLLTMPS